jgi:Cu+-exporting ATPase
MIDSPRSHLDLPVEGMTCAGCVARIERRLNALDGVEASVNLALERAAVDYDAARVAPGDLVAAVAAAGYTARLPDATDPTAQRDDRLGLRVVVAALLAVPVIVYAMAGGVQTTGRDWIALALTLPVVVWCGWPIHRAALRSLRHGTATMDTLISMGVAAALGWSVVALLVPSWTDHLYLEVAAGVTLFILLGRYLEARAKRRASSALRALATGGVRDVAVLGDDGEHRVPLRELRVGDVFVVRPGELIATDGVVREGHSAVDRSLLTGESMPVEVGPDDAVTGATVNVGGRLVVEATRIGADTALARITKLVEEAQSGKAAVQRLADRVAAVFVPIVIVIAAVTLLAWLATGAPADQAFANAVAVLIIACPCALGLATPMALLVGTGRGAQLGILIRGPEVLESARAIDTVVLDKTGTVTTGTLAVVDVTGDRDALPLAAAVEHASEHPVARALAATVEHPEPVGAFVAHAGLGAEGVVGGRRVLVGRPRLLQDSGMDLPALLAGAAARYEAAGRTAVAIAVDGEPRAVVALADTLRTNSASAIVQLRALGLRMMLLTGDNRRTAAAVADAVGIREVISEVLPQDKERIVARLQGEGRTVAMVGDGVNDAPALARAELGIAIGGGTDIAVEAADITLTGGDLGETARAIRLSRSVLGTIRGNLFWAFAYNVAAIPLAAAGLLQPMVAGAAMACSSLFVVANSLRLRRFS